MAETTTTLTKEVPTGVEIQIPVENLQHDDIAPNTGKVYVNGTVEPKATLGIAQAGKVLVRNNTGKPWAAGTEVRVTWDDHVSGGVPAGGATRGSRNAPPRAREPHDDDNSRDDNRDGRGARAPMRETFRQQQEEKAEAFKVADDIRYQRATRGVVDNDMRDRVLAMGGDATRASPDPAQPLDDATPGLTTTTGAHRTPIDPTTAAVPAAPGSELVEKMRGAPTVGSGRQHDQPEELWAEGEHTAQRQDRRLPGGRPV